MNALQARSFGSKLGRYLKDPSVSRWRKIAGVVALGYLVLPFDAVPDVIPVLGWLDDIGVLSAAAWFVTREVKRHSVPSPWTGRATKGPQSRRRRRPALSALSPPRPTAHAPLRDDGPAPPHRSGGRSDRVEEIEAFDDTPQEHEPMTDLARWLSTGQAAYYVVAGAWPLVHQRSFDAITGPKPEDGLVKTVGALVTVIGGAIGLASRSRRVTPELRFLAAGAALSMAAVEAFYLSKRRLRSVYLLDVLPQVAIAGAWMLDAWQSRARSAEVESPTRPLPPEYLH